MAFSANNLWLMRQFYITNAAAEFLEQVVQEFGMDGSGFWQQPVAKLGNLVKSGEKPSGTAAASGMTLVTPIEMPEVGLAFDAWVSLHHASIHVHRSGAKFLVPPMWYRVG